MASPIGYGACSGSSQVPSWGYEEESRQTVKGNLNHHRDFQMLQRKQKQMISNRESARRSRTRKQKHLEDLAALAGQLGEENRSIVTSVNVTTRLCINVEAENSVLRAQAAELTHSGGFEGTDNQDFAQVINGDDLFNQWNSLYVNQPNHGFCRHVRGLITCFMECFFRAAKNV
ncbi:hypothetical protein U1Q18_011633 [Sarracenia purpurea var. burkii]